MLRKFCDLCGLETTGASLIGEIKVRLKPETMKFEIKWSVEEVSEDGRRTPDAHGCTDCVKAALKRAFA
jgi:hypothetical protein